MITKKVFYKYLCNSCSYDWKDGRKDRKKCPECGGNNIKVIGFSGYIGPVEEDIAYA